MLPPEPKSRRSALGLMAVFCVALGLLSLSACRTTKIPPERVIQVPPGLSATEVRAGIVRAFRSDPSYWTGSLKQSSQPRTISTRRVAARGRNWLLQSADDEVIRATLKVRASSIDVAIPYDEAQCSIRITGSRNLKQKGDRIHKSAVSWVREFGNRI